MADHQVVQLTGLSALDKDLPTGDVAEWLKAAVC
jgi:hypothetical protein